MAITGMWTRLCLFSCGLRITLNMMLDGVALFMGSLT